MNEIKKTYISFIKVMITLLVGVFFSYLYMQNFLFLEHLNNKFKDIFFNIRGEISPNGQVVIVDIDEEAQSVFNGFSRKEIAKVISRLADENVSIIGLDMAFPRDDSSSPNVVSKKLGEKSTQKEDYDLSLANAFKKTSVISGYMFDFSTQKVRGSLPHSPCIFVQKNFKTKEYLPIADGIISNIEILQKNSYSSGFFNLIADDDGVVRSLPLVIKYKENLYPSLVLEMARVFLKKEKIIISYSSAGISEIRLDDFTIPTDRFGRLMVNFKGKSKSYKHIFAADILNDNFQSEEIKDKVVFIGASASRFLDLRAIPLDSTFEGVEIHASALDNILNQDFLTKPDWIEAVDIAVLFLIVFLVLVFSFLRPLKNGLLVAFLMVGFFYVAFYVFVKFGLILGVIYPLIAGFFLYSILTLLHYWVESKQKERLNQELFLQMQDRQKNIEEKVKERTRALEVALKEKNILFRELHHRVKNNLQLILSIVRLQQYDKKDALLHEEFEKLQGRIKSIAKTHEMLCESDDISNVDMSDYLGRLGEEIESSLGQNEIKIELDVVANLPLRQAVYVGLIVNELIANSIKHAFHDKGGKIFISLLQENKNFILKVWDTGVIQSPISLQKNSLGLKLVDSLVIHQLDGQIQMNTQKRFEYVIKFGLSEGE